MSGLRLLELFGEYEDARRAADWPDLAAEPVHRPVEEIARDVEQAVRELRA